jgi:hypothetical protein
LPNGNYIEMTQDSAPLNAYYFSFAIPRHRMVNITTSP